MSIPWHGQDRVAMQGFRQAPPAQHQPQTPRMLPGRAAPGIGSPFPAKTPFSREGKRSTEVGAMHPLAQGRSGLKARGPLSNRVAVLPQGAAVLANLLICAVSFFILNKTV